MSGLVDAIARFDVQLYLALTSARDDLAGLIALVIVALNFNGYVWYVVAYLAYRARRGRRGIGAALTVLAGLALAWWTAELLKFVFRRERPFNALPDAPPILQFEPLSYSFPSGDAALAMGAAVALGTVYPAARAPAVIFAAAVAVARVVVGVHHPLDAVAGALVGVSGGLLAPEVVSRLRRYARWRGYVVAHTHWDREWYERFEGYRARLVPMVTKLLALLERDPSFRSFTFDGQTIAIEDHLAERPADRPRVEALVRADRLLVGPWYVLADLLLVSGESIVRNLQEGLRVSGELGRAMRVAYVADPFGHPAQVPQILRGFGYTSYVFARGVGSEGDALGSEFMWEAPSGDRVLACHQIEHYSGALPLVYADGRAIEDVAPRVRRMLPRIFRRLARHASGDALLFMVGDDHTEAFERLPEAVAAARRVLPRVDLRIASLEEFVEALPSPAAVASGEMVNGYYRPILRGVNSTRVWIKQENARAERLLLERCEPLDAMTGGGARDELRSLWRTLLENHPHDSICGCSIDAVHDLDMRPRFERVRRDGESLAGRLAAAAAPGAGPAVYDPLPYGREAVVDAGEPTLVRTAGLGTAPLVRVAGRAPSAEGEGTIANEHFRVEVAPDGSFVVVDRASGERTGTQNALVDDGDRGDEYTYSYAGPTLRAAGLRGRLSAGVSGDRASVRADLVLRLPAGLRPDRFARSAELVEVPVSCTVSLDAGARRVDVAVRVENAARDHRLRALCATGTRTLDHVAGAAFALLTRPNRIPRPRGWVEPPTEERCAHDLVAVVGATRGLAVGLDGIREYAVLDEGRTIAVTLFRAVGWLSRGDLRERRGHAGPALETPTAQCPGALDLRYCVVPLFGSRDLVPARREIRSFLSPPVPLERAAERTFLTLDPASPVELSSLRAAAGGGLVLRLHNPSGAAAETALRFERPVASARPVDLREAEPGLGSTGLDVIRTAAPLEVEGARAVARLAPYEIGTWVVTLAG